MRKAVFIAVLTALLATSCVGNDGSDSKVTSLGSIEVTAKLLDVGGDFPPNDLYDYAHIMKYEIIQTHRGAVDGNVIYVGHYNPLKPRANVADDRVKEIGGNVARFTAGDVHRMALEGPIDDHYMGAMVNRFPESEKGVIYWALWTNRVAR